MQILRSKISPLCRPFSLAAVSLIWIPLSLGTSAHAFAQQGAQDTETSVAASAPVVPQQVRYAGKLASHAGVTVDAQFRIYAAAEGGEPLWTETQRIPVGEDGSYTVLLGSAESKGLPQTVFAGGVARWLGVSVDGAVESERVLLASVPYAMKSADAEALAGHAASDFVTQEQLAALTAQGEQPVAPTAPTSSITPLLSGTITGSGTAGNIAQFTGANTIGNSEITQVGSDIGINVATPAATLDVGGTTVLGGTVTLPATGPATTATGTKSELLQMQGSTWSSTTSAPVAQTYTLSVNPANNNTTTPSSDLVLQYASGTSPATNLFYVNSNGQITFAPTQTFPGTLTSVSATTPLAASTNPSGAVSLSLDTGTLISTLDGYFPRLTLPNTFANSEIFTSTVTVDGTLTAAGNLSVGGTLSSAHGFQSTGSFVVQPTGPATSSAGVNSALLEIGGSSYSSTSASAVAQNFAWQTLVTGNDTASPSSKLALLYGSGTTAPSTTGLSIAPNGQITFAPGQTFPVMGSGGGTITGITTSSPLTGGGTTGSVALGLNTSALETTLSSVYAQLGAADTFTGADVFNGGLTANASSGSAAITGNGTMGVTGIEGTTDTGAAVSGSATGNGFGGYFVNNSAGSPTIYAANNATASSLTPMALSAFVPNADSIGIGGEAQGYASIGVYGNTKGQGSISVFGLANGIGATGVSGVENGTDIGEGPQNIGVSGTASVGIGVMGTSIGASSTSSTLETYRPQAGVWGDTRGGSLVNFSPAVLGTADDTYAGYFKNNSYDAPTINVINTGTGINGAAIFQSAATGSPAIVVDNTGGDAAATLINDSNTSPTLFLSNYGTGGVTNFAAKKMGPANDALFKTFMASTPTGTCGIGGNGDLSCTGQMKSLVSAGDGSRKVETYAMQSPENWMEDFGTATLENGVAVVRIDPAFAETVSGSNDYHVFLTPRGDSNGLYVINATPASFEVRESKGGTSSLSFDYRIVAKRRGYEVQRLRDVTESFNEAKALVKRPDSPRTPTLLPTPVLQMKPGIAPAHPPGIPKAIQAELEASEHQAYPAHPATPKGIQLKETPTSSTHP